MDRSVKHSVEDYRRLAQRRLPRVVFDFLEGGADDEHGLSHNREIFRKYRLVPRRLVDVSTRDSSVQWQGSTLSAPIIIAPTGFNGLYWHQGDIALARAAAAHGIPFVLSTASNTSIETLANRCQAELWFQLYAMHDSLSVQWVRRALHAGYQTLVLTVDASANGNRERDVRNGFTLPFRHRLATLADGLKHPRWALQYLRHGPPQFANLAQVHSTDTDADAMHQALARRAMDASIDWDSLRRLRDLWPRSLLVKGILHPDDARQCISAGADGVILSNHGARQLDSCVSPMEILGRVRKGVSGAVLIDSGFRRGSDIVKAVALGAQAVLLGRATLYGLAAAGEQGADAVIAILKREIDQTLAQLGCANLAQLSADHILLDDDATKTTINERWDLDSISEGCRGRHRGRDC